MRQTEAPLASAAQAMPAHLRESYKRLRAAGIEATLPTAGPGVPLPELVELGGKSLSEIVGELRDRE